MIYDCKIDNDSKIYVWKIDNHSIVYICKINNVTFNYKKHIFLIKRKYLSVSNQLNPDKIILCFMIKCLIIKGTLS